MRPRIVEALNAWSGTELFSWIVPDPAFVYALAIGVVVWVFVRRAASDALSRVHALGAAIWAVAAGLIGARVFFLIQHVDLLLARPSILLDLNDGTVSWGAYLGGSLAFVLYLRRHQQPLLRFLDVLASCAGLGPFIARWACFLNGDDYGTLTTLPWGVAFPHGSYPFATQVQAGLLDALASLSLPVHPVQVYLSLKGLMLFIVGTVLWRRRVLPPGMLFGVYWMMFAVLRFALEFFRGDASRGFVGVLSVGQVMSLLIVLLSGAMLIIVSRKQLPLAHPVAGNVRRDA